MSDPRSQRRWDPFEELQREMGRLFESLDPKNSTRQVHRYPPLNLYDAADRYILSVQLPGMEPSDIELTITGETLTLRGERTWSEGVKEDSYRRQERPMGRWSRTITLPDRVESAHVGASLADGILTVTFPKAEEAQPRQIIVTAASAPS
jgi:HSP20 family protein